MSRWIWNVILNALWLITPFDSCHLNFPRNSDLLSSFLVSLHIRLALRCLSFFIVIELIPIVECPSGTKHWYMFLHYMTCMFHYLWPRLALYPYWSSLIPSVLAVHEYSCVNLVLADSVCFTVLECLESIKFSQSFNVKTVNIYCFPLICGGVDVFMQKWSSRGMETESAAIWDCLYVTYVMITQIFHPCLWILLCRCKFGSGTECHIAGSIGLSL